MAISALWQSWYGMDLDWMEDFLTLLDCGSFSRAAERRNVTQPAFGRRIRALERWVGTDLVDRSTKRNAATPAGLAMRPAAEQALRRLHQGRQQALAASKTASACIPFACTHLLSSTFFPRFLPAIEVELPEDVHLQFLVDNMEACERFMLQGEVALLLCHHHAGAPSDLEGRHFERITIGHDRLLPLTGIGASGMPLYEIPLGSGSSAPFLAYRESSGLGRILEGTKMRERVGGTFDEVFYSHAALTLAMLAISGRGIAWLPLSAVSSSIADGKLAVVGDEDWAVDIEIVLYRPTTKQTPPIEAFWSLAKARHCKKKRDTPRLRGCGRLDSDKPDE